MIRTAHCHVLDADVTLLVDMEGVVTRVVCPEYDAAHQQCRRKQQDASEGPLARLIDRTAEHRLAERSDRCHLIP